jgi:hypothetical protein
MKDKVAATARHAALGEGLIDYLALHVSASNQRRSV